MNEDNARKSYFKWLCDLVRPSGGWPGGKSYSFLLALLHKKEFYSIIGFDENWISHGKQLRYTFVTEIDKEGWLLALDGPCSVMEVMVAIARKTCFEMSGLVEENDTARWFWEMCTNAGIACSDDEWHVRDAYLAVEDRIEEVLSREYSRGGNGGFFPLKHAATDQRKTDLWHQCNAYLMEKYG